MTVSQISQRLCLADSNQCHNAYGSLEDEGYLSRMDDVDLGDDDTSYQVASSQNREHQENSTLQHLTESSEGKENNDGLTLNAHDCTTVEESTNNHEEESLLRADLCEILEGKRLFEEDRQSRRSFMADLQESLKKKQPDSEKGDSIQSNRAEVNDFSKLQSSQNDSKCGNLEVPHQNTKAQAPSGNLISRNVSNHENGQRISSHEGNTAKEEDKLMRIHQLPQGPALNNVKDRNDLDTEAKCELPGDVSSGLPKTTLVKEYRFTASNESDSSSILERETYAKNVETARNDVFLSEQNAIKTNRETSRNQEVQGTIGVIQGDQEGQRQTKPGGNKFKSIKQHLEEESERSEVEIRGNRGNTPEKQETPCSDSELRSTISNRNESTIRSLCQGGDIVADGESLEELDKNAVAVDGSVLEKNSHNGIHAMIVMPNRAVQDAIAVDQRQTKPGVNKLEIREQHFVEDRERSGVEIIGNRSNTPEKQGTSCPDYDEMTTERTFVSPIEDGLRDGTKNKDTVRSQNDVVNLLRETYAEDGPNLKEENETRSLKQSLGAIKLMDPHGQAHFKSRATLSNRHEITSRSMCHGCDVVADGGSRGDLINNVDTVDGPALTQNLHKDFYAGEKFKTSVKHKSVTLGGENESHTDALCKSRYPLEPKSNLFQSHSGDGGARPKQRSTDNTKTRLPRTSNKNPMSANSDLERIYPGLDPDFLARHVKESSPLLPFHNGGNYNHASSDGLWQDYEQEYFSFNAQDQVFNSKDKKSHFMEEFIPRDKANRYDKVIPVYNALADLVPLNGKEKESWHFPSSESCKDMVLRNQCFAERTNESNPTSLPKSLDANRVKPFCTCGSACAYKDMASMANDSSTSVGNDECGQSPPMSENEHSWTENALTANFRYLQEIMAKTIRLVALSATGAKENHPANQTVEKTGIQEETGDMGEAEAAVTQRIYETNTQRESTPSNETTVEAERQPTATPVQESPRPVCSHYQRRCLVRFPCCGKFFPCHRCHNESDCNEDQARAVNATHIRCTICYHEQEVRFLFMILCLCFHVKIRYLE